MRKFANVIIHVHQYMYNDSTCNDKQQKIAYLTGYTNNGMQGNF